MEDGEILNDDLDVNNHGSGTIASTTKLCSAPRDTYDPSYEWPGEASNTSTDAKNPDGLYSYSSGNITYPTSASTSAQPCFRLIVHRTSILPSNHKLAIVDGYTQLRFGRDVAGPGTDIPQIRLKEMEVSKVHATAYWDFDRQEWGIVDMGSKHGTFIGSTPASGNGGVSHRSGMRLSPPRVASIPRRLHHLDVFSIGSTVFLVHIHDDQIPCEECSPSGGDEIPLFPVQRSKDGRDSVASKRSRDAAGLDLDASTYAVQSTRDPKKALTMLKHSLLTRHREAIRPSSPKDTGARYVDRSARRRALHSSSHSDPPGVSPPFTRSNSPAIADPLSRAEVDPELVTSRLPVPLPTTNIGHRLLLKQGWQPGTALGVSQDATVGRMGLVEPLEVSSSSNRAGLGMTNAVLSSAGSYASGSNWKEGAKRKRWDSLGSGIAHQTT